MFVFAVAGWAQQDANIGTWKLNVAKSKYDPGPLPKSLTLKIEPSGSNGVKLTTDGVDAQGKPTHNEALCQNGPREMSDYSLGNSKN